MPDSLLAAARKMAERLRAWRRYLHANPELGGQERATADFVAGELRRLGYQPAQGVGGTFGLIATLHVGEAPAVALRADMDGLPIQEETGLDFASRSPGVMHACGHDAHMAMLLGAAGLLKQHQAELKRSVKLICPTSYTTRRVTIQGKLLQSDPQRRKPFGARFSTGF